MTEELKTQQNTDKLLRFIAEKFEQNELDNNSLVQLIILSASYLNLKTISEYAKENKMTYNGVKYHRKIVNLLNQKYVIEND